LQSFQWRLLQQNQGVPDIVAVRFGMSREDLLDATRELPCPTLSLGRIACVSTLFHAGAGSVSGFSRHVIAIPKLETDVPSHGFIHFDSRRPSLFEASA
jgi:hypothetical protein